MSIPPIASLTKPKYTVQFEPLKGEQSSFERFRLTIVNLSDEDLHIDWHRTLYLLNGRSFGAFVSKRGDPDHVKDPETRYETVTAGTTFMIEIAPVFFIADASARYRENAPWDAPNFRAGPIPSGRSGIRLVMTQGYSFYTEALSLQIMVEDVG